MNARNDGVSLLYAIGILFDLLAVLYFNFEVIVGLSPTVKATLLLLGFLGPLAGASIIDRSGLSEALYALSAVSYLMFVL